jgi:tetratricopeptide (TPR) repeat protein
MIAAPLTRLSESTGKELETVVAEWGRQRTCGLATELIASVGFVGDARLVDDAAKFLLRDDRVAPVVKMAARDLLDGGTPAEHALIDANDHIRCARQRLMKDPRDVLAALNLAHGYAGLGLPDKAERYLNYALSLAPSHRLVLRSAARFYLHIEETDQAHQLLLGARHLLHDPWLLAAEIAFAEVRGKTSKYMREASAMASSESLPALHRSELRAALAGVEFSRGAAKKSKKLLIHALEQPTENVIAQAQFVTERRQINGLPVDAAIEASHMANEARGYAAINQKDWQSAVSAAEEWMAEEPFSTRPLGLGFHAAEQGLGDIAKAESFARRTIILKPNDAIFHNNLAYVLALQNKTEEAKVALSRAFLYFPLSAERDRHEVILKATAGLIAWREGDAEAGRHGYEQAAEYLAKTQDASLANAWVCRAREEFRAGNVTVAGELLARATRQSKIKYDPLVEAVIKRLGAHAQMLVNEGTEQRAIAVTSQGERLPGKEVITMATTTKTIFRRSDNGRLTTKDYAEKHPKTTEKERVRVPTPKPKGSH